MIIILTVLTFLIMLLSYIIGLIRSKRQQKEDEEIQRLKAEINRYNELLNRSRQEYRTMKVNDITNLPEGVNNILDLYDNSNIRIPKDILEDITRQSFYNESEILDYIENQRFYWKLENSKKVYKRK